MTATVVRRTFRSSPYRDALQTWQIIVDVLAGGRDCAARTELLAVAGIVASIIADQAPKDSPLVVTCDGPLTRVYCLYDDDAMDSSCSEDPLGFDCLNGDWRVSLPCGSEDLSWVQTALKKHDRITARETGAAILTEQSEAAEEPLTLDPKALLRQ
jgi:hypothetical protein